MQCADIKEEILDRYSMGTLSGDLIPEVEEHLLTCSECQSRLVETDQFVRVFRAAATQVDARPVPFWKNLLGARGARWAGLGLALASLVIVVNGVIPRGSNTPPAIVLMQDLRGPEAGTIVAAGRPAVLVFDLGVQGTSENYDAKILNPLGAQILSTKAGITDGRISVAIQKLVRGSYWVRLYRRDNHELAAEYILRAE